VNLYPSAPEEEVREEVNASKNETEEDPVEEEDNLSEEDIYSEEAEKQA